MANTTYNGNNRVSAHEAISKLGSGAEKGLSKEKEKQIKYEEKYRADERAKLVKKGIKDEIKLANAGEEEIAKNRKRLDKKNLQQRIADEKEALKELSKYAVTANERFSAQAKLSTIQTAENLGKAVSSAVSKAFSGLTTGIDNYLGAYSKYMTGIEARIQGGAKSFSSITGMISRDIGSSQYVSQAKVLENLSGLVEQGILYNVEQRAFLQTISEKIATTFDAANGTLLRLIKIQQADSTAARLGMEATLTQFFNQMYEDTSYLNKGGTSSAVSSAILGASSQLGRDRSVAFEYNVQKWLGSLSSVGVSDATIQSIAQGLNYLGTGDITGLSGNTSLQNLLAISASRAGLDYGGILNKGLTPETANVLLRSIIEYGQQMAGVESQVIKSQYAQIFGLTVSDLTALLNLTSSDLDTISKSLLSYTDATAEVNSQITKIPGRMTLKERLDTMFENVMSGVGENIANNAGMYGTYLINSMIMDATEGGLEINLPFLGPVNLNKTIQGGIVGLSLISELGSILSGLSGANTLSLNNWGTKDVRVRGAGFTGIKTTGVTSLASQTAYIGGTAEESELYQQSLQAASDKAAQAVSGQAESSEETMSRAVADGINKENGLVDKIYQLLSSWDDSGRIKTTGGLFNSNEQNV